MIDWLSSRRRWPATLAVLALTLVTAGCEPGIYVRDGVTDGNVFYILPRTLEDPDPVNQSWVAYSIARTSCELEMGGPVPSRNTAFACELFARQLLLDTWASYRLIDDVTDDYLDLLAGVQAEGFLDEYVWHYLRRRAWQAPAELEHKRFDRWRREALAGHEPVTDLRGAWIVRDE